MRIVAKALRQGNVIEGSLVASNEELSNGTFVATVLVPAHTMRVTYRSDEIVECEDGPYEPTAPSILFAEALHASIAAHPTDKIRRDLFRTFIERALEPECTLTILQLEIWHMQRMTDAPPLTKMLDHAMKLLITLGELT